MRELYPKDWPQFYTATIQGWKHLLKEEEFKNVIINALKFLVENKRVKINAFVIMDNHIHFIWQAMDGYSLREAQTSFKKFTARQFLKLLQEDKQLIVYKVFKPDRQHNFWKRNSLGIELFTEYAFLQKLNYIHNNPVMAGFCKFPEEYRYSSAGFYMANDILYNFLEHYKG